MTSPIGFPPETVYAISGISQEMPGMVTVDSVAQPNAFFLAPGMTVTISGVVGMHQVNFQRYIIGSLDTESRTFRLYNSRGQPVDTTSFNAYVSGGQLNIVSYPAQAGSPPGLMYNTQPINI